MSAKKGFIQRVVALLKGTNGGDSPTLAALRLELDECKREVGRLKKEYVLQREQARGQGERMAAEALEGIVQEFASPLATLAAMEVRHREYGDLQTSDVLQVAASLQAILAQRGMEQIGQVGEEQLYDPVLHQVLDASHPEPGQPVRIRFAGFRFKGRLVARAQVGSATPIT